MTRFIIAAAAIIAPGLAAVADEAAVDAAIAANAALGLMEPTGNGIGGDLFAIVWSAQDRKLTGLNASGRSPAAWTPEFFKDHKTMPQRGWNTR